MKGSKKVKTPTINIALVNRSYEFSQSQPSLSVKSSRSIVSDDFLAESHLEEIKESKVKVVNKNVIKWTPVIIGKAFPPHI